MKRVKVRTARTEKPRQTWPRWSLVLLTVLFVVPAFAMEYTAFNSPAKSAGKKVIKKVAAPVKKAVKAPVATAKTAAGLLGSLAVGQNPAALAVVCVTPTIGQD